MRESPEHSMKKPKRLFRHPQEIVMPMTPVYRLPASPCPICEVTLNAAANCFDETAPGPGDVTICIACGTLLRFAADLTLRLMSPEEESALRRDNPLLAKIERAWDEMMKEERAR
jgi:hypothetical protein